jgi:hypothetical protein
LFSTSKHPPAYSNLPPKSPANPLDAEYAQVFKSRNPSPYGLTKTTRRESGDSYSSMDAPLTIGLAPCRCEFLPPFFALVMFCSLILVLVVVKKKRVITNHREEETDDDEGKKRSDARSVSSRSVPFFFVLFFGLLERVIGDEVFSVMAHWTHFTCFEGLCLHCVYSLSGKPSCFRALQESRLGRKTGKTRAVQGAAKGAPSIYYLQIKPVLVCGRLVGSRQGLPCFCRAWMVSDATPNGGCQRPSSESEETTTWAPAYRVGLHPRNRTQGHIFRRSHSRHQSAGGVGSAPHRRSELP